MKIRDDFVSNSSSCSYIVEFKNLEQTICIAGEDISVEDFFNMIRSLMQFNGTTEMCEITIDDSDRKDLIETIDQTIQFEEGERKDKLLYLKNDIQNTDKKFARFSISYHHKALQFLFKLLVKYELFDIRFAYQR